MVTITNLPVIDSSPINRHSINQDLLSSEGTEKKLD